MQQILPVTLPANWERAFGYRGDARWLAAYWTPAGDEAVYDDGLVSATANYRVYISLLKDYRKEITDAMIGAGACPPDAAWSAVYCMGSSNDDATHCFLLDLQERQIYAADLQTGLQAVADQHPPAPPVEISDEDLDQLLRDIAGMRVTTGEFRLCTCSGGWLKTPNGYAPCPAGCDNGVVWTP